MKPMQRDSRTKTLKFELRFTKILGRILQV